MRSLRRLVGLFLVLASAFTLRATATAFKLGKPTNAGTVTIASSDTSALQISRGGGDVVGWVTTSANGMVTFDLTKGAGAGPYQFDTSGMNRVNNLLKVTNPAGGVTRTITVSVAIKSSPTATYTPVPASFSLTPGASQEISFDIQAGPGTAGPDTITVLIASN